MIAEDTIAYYEDFIELYPTDPLLFQIKTLLASKILSVAWYNTVLQNSPAAYEAFYSEYGSSQYAQAALKLQQQPKLKPVFQPSTIIMPAQLAPQIKLTSLPQPQLKTLPSLKPSVGQQLDFTTSANATRLSVGNDKDVAQDQRDQQKQRTGLATDQLPLPGKSLLGVRLPARHVDAINPNVRIVALPDAGKVRIGSRMALGERRSPRFVDLPPRPAPRMEQMMPRPGDPSPRFRPGVRVAGEVGGPQQAPRGPGQLQFRGPVSNAVARVGRRCATIDDHPVCR